MHKVCTDCLLVLAYHEPAAFQRLMGSQLLAPLCNALDVQDVSSMFTALCNVRVHCIYVRLPVTLQRSILSLIAAYCRGIIDVQSAGLKYILCTSVCVGGFDDAR
jgi:hypothetical protein